MHYFANGSIPACMPSLYSETNWKKRMQTGKGKTARRFSPRLDEKIRGKERRKMWMAIDFAATFLILLAASFIAQSSVSSSDPLNILFAAFIVSAVSSLASLAFSAVWRKTIGDETDDIGAALVLVYLMVLFVIGMGCTFIGLLLAQALIPTFAVHGFIAYAVIILLNSCATSLLNSTTRKTA